MHLLSSRGGVCRTPQRCLAHLTPDAGPSYAWFHETGSIGETNSAGWEKMATRNWSKGHCLKLREPLRKVENGKHRLSVPEIHIHKNKSQSDSEEHVFIRMHTVCYPSASSGSEQKGTNTRLLVHRQSGNPPRTALAISSHSSLLPQEEQVPLWSCISFISTFYISNMPLLLFYSLVLLSLFT